MKWFKALRRLRAWRAARSSGVVDMRPIPSEDLERARQFVRDSGWVK